ncbi:hypothetical protein LEP1GSC038_0606 [Leptospira weilii str. 2006001855]|uniref:Uncharacterized protein n=1 Tax=Leptospira weilii str. 2006001855 TaxID=996804 RepID=M6FIJ5_9LEPT|nr:hypothetical protein LEP1GSC038_0606 [Leptospira weilii str. 2006001855]
MYNPRSVGCIRKPFLYSRISILALFRIRNRSTRSGLFASIGSNYFSFLVISVFAFL